MCTMSRIAYPMSTFISEAGGISNTFKDNNHTSGNIGLNDIRWCKCAYGFRFKIMGPYMFHDFYTSNLNIHGCRISQTFQLYIQYGRLHNLVQENDDAWYFFLILQNYGCYNYNVLAHNILFLLPCCCSQLLPQYIRPMYCHVRAT